MIRGIFQPPVSRFTAASVAMHCGAKTNQASSDKAVAKLQVCAIMGASVWAAALPLLDKAYTVASALTATSRAARPGTSAMLICQLKPIGANRSEERRVGK